MPTLYVVATPIGNLNDFSPRGIETLKNADMIAAEDTRVTMKLCNKFDIHTRLISCHQHNENEKGPWLAQKMLDEDLNVALTTDAGTPCISDPGYALIRECVERGINVIPVPGCCAAVTALSVCGMDTREFSFYGFLPRDKKECSAKVMEISKHTRIAVIHESPFRITETLGWISDLLPETEAAVCSDLTKIHEKVFRGKLPDIVETLKNDPKAEKGEYCIVLQFPEYREETKENSVPDLSPEAAIVELMKDGKSLREAQEILIEKGMKKNLIKQAAIDLKKLFQ